MPSFHTTRRVQHSAENMFFLVADIERYPEFVPLCEALTIRSRQEDAGHEILIADMTVAYKFLHETFTSRVRLNRASLEIVSEYIDGPFQMMENRWHFRDLGEKNSEVDFYIDYEFRSRSFQLLVGALFDKAFRKFSGAFEKRADEIYGRSS